MLQLIITIRENRVLTQLFADTCVYNFSVMFCLSSKGPTLSCDIFPPFEANDGSYVIGLVDLATYNSIPNIETGVNDKFYYGSHVITHDEGSYELENIEKHIIQNLSSGVSLSLKANNNTVKAEIKCSDTVDFTKSDSIGGMLGFSSKVLSANKRHISDQSIKIIKVNTVRVECNLVKGSFDNGKEGHVMLEFFPDVGLGYKIIEVLSTIIYLPLNVQRVTNITVFLKDQDGSFLNFRDEIISLRIHIKSFKGSSI